MKRVGLIFLMALISGCTFLQGDKTHQAEPSSKQKNQEKNIAKSPDLQASELSVGNGFLPDYKRLKTVVHDDGTKIERWISKKLTRKRNQLKPKSFFIKPVIFYPQLPLEPQVTSENLRLIQGYLNREIHRVARKHFEITNTFGPQVFVIEPAITGVETSLESISPMEVIPFKALLSTVNLAMGGRDRDVEVRLEIRVSLSQTGEILSTGVYRDKGRQLENSKEPLTKDHVKELLDQWLAVWDKELAHYRKTFAVP